MPFPLTQEQRDIVNDRGGELLVSAAAGSGKTRVLVERLLDRVTKEGLDIDQFLVITYTKAAAAELRSRIAQELSDRLGQNPNDRHLRRQTTLVYKAQICTIHAFCSALIRENGQLLDLDGDFRLCDEGEAGILMSNILEEVLDKRYEDIVENSPFAQLADTLGAGRDDGRLAQITLDIFSRVQSHPDPTQWLNEQKQVWALDGISDISDTSWGALLLKDKKRTAHYCKERMEQALNLAAKDELLETNYVPSISATLEALDEFLAAKNWDQAVSSLPIPFPLAGRKKKRKIEVSFMEEECSAQYGERLKAIRNRCKDMLEKLNQEMDGNTSSLMEELMLSRPTVQALMDLVLDFQTAYAQEKRRRSVIDFSDLEHFAVQLLIDETNHPTHLAQLWSNRYEEILVDEYQDTNQVQNAIFYAISNQGRKLFQVGDVKQSIYRFRLADPTIFLEKYHRFPHGDQAEDGCPRKLVLSQNFRSRSEVLEGCNDLFRNIMSTEFGEMDYTEDQALVPGKTFSGDGHYAVELNALDLSFLGEQEGEKENKDLLEARFTARRIRQMLEEPLMIEEDDKLRPVRPSDVMILLRSPGNVLNYYTQALNEENITWTADGDGEFFETTEVNVALAILQIVDNPHQDVPLIATLRSPVYGFTGDKLAVLRSESDGDFYAAMVHAAEHGDRDCQNFLSQLSQLRLGAGERTCRQLIWHIYEKTNLLGIFGAMDRGQERQDNLYALYALAGQLEESNCKTLFQFLLRLDRLRENGTKFSATGAGRTGEGVSILSIHRSKGLEKPVVFICGLTRRLNRDSLMHPVLFHPVLGVGPKGLDRDRMIEYDTLARRAVKSQLEREMMAEELRLLYVAMTRAREKLILNLTLPKGIQTLERLGEGLSVPVSPMVLEQQQNVGAWIFLHVLTRPEAEGLRSMANLPDIQFPHTGPAWEIHWIDGQSLNEVQVSEGSVADLPGEEQDTEELIRRLGWEYPHRIATDVPSKLTATQIKGRALDHEIMEDAAILPSRKNRPITRPNFIAQERGLTPTQQGTALHLAMQYLSMKKDHTLQTVTEELDQLVENGFLTPLQRQYISPARLTAFWTSEIGQEMTSAEKSGREFKFSVLVPAGDYYPNIKREEILLQGVIDAWYETLDGIIVLDFKTDKVSPGKERAKAEEYRNQLEAYQRALSEILKQPVTKCILWFFATDTPVEL